MNSTKLLLLSSFPDIFSKFFDIIFQQIFYCNLVKHFVYFSGSNQSFSICTNYFLLQQTLLQFTLVKCKKAESR